MRNRKRSATLPIGSISEGTLRLQDLLPALLSELESLRLTRAERATVREQIRMWREFDMTAVDDDVLGDAYEQLVTIANNHTPYCAYLGSINGDGACIGIWPDVDCATEESVTISDTSELATLKGASLALHVNDHGNATLYRRAGNRWIEVWAVV